MSRGRVFLLLAAVAAAVPSFAQAIARPLPPAERLTPEALDGLFDGSRPLPAQPDPEPRRILYPESDTTPAAPRFALDLDAVPPELRRTIPGFEALPHKNQEETPEQVARTNELIRRYNRRRLLGKKPEWTYDGRPNEPVWTCLSHAAATANDWWALQQGRELPSHRSISHGGLERGLDPNMLELEYFERANAGEPDFVALPKFVQKDPVRNTPFPYEPRGYAELLTGGPFEVQDPLTRETLRFTPESSAMEGEWLQLFTNSLFRGRTPARHAKTLAEGLERWGIAYVQLEHTKHPRWPGAHAVAVVGYFCMEPGERLVQCSENRTDEDWGRTAYFIAHDTFGNFPASQPRTGNSASAYRAVQITSIDQAIVFPHGLRVSVAPKPGVPGVWTLQVANQGGVPVPPTDVKALDAADREVPVLADSDGSRYLQGRPGDAVRLYVEAPHYRHRDGRGRSFAAKLDAVAPADAVPLTR